MMPLFDFLCSECGEISEILIAASSDQPECQYCGSVNLEKMLSAHSSFSGTSKSSFPGNGDTACCGSNPGQAGCAGPGSCCGKMSV